MQNIVGDNMIDLLKVYEAKEKMTITKFYAILRSHKDAILYCSENNQYDADLLATFEIIEDIIGALATGKENKYYNAIKGDKNE